jgi:predicted secreted hydrolase
MNARLLIFAGLTMLLTSSPLLAQGFAGLGSGGKGFKDVTPDISIEFPRDFGKHPGFRIEWWYVTANLEATDGRKFGVQWTLFRQAATPNPFTEGWSSGEFWMGHAAITSKDQHLFAEKLARGGVGQSDVELEPFNAWIDDWTFQSMEDTYRVNAYSADFRYDLTLVETGPKTLHGQNGFSVKSDQGQASYYFSQPFFDAAGTIKVAGKEIEVTGKAWLDREWSSQPLAANQKGWDWFSLKLDDGTRVMLFQLREDNGGVYYSGTWIKPDGATQALGKTDIEMQPLTISDVRGKNIPTSWKLVIPSKRVDLTVHALNDDSWMATSVPYWEGPISIQGSHTGEGYLEMTGY